ncbi:MAG TPA: tripartite tricarboxylate transporter TctB family protein, partial [Devosia sp.]|nr:tripartite tricarboxylate transporter TctB family protein [Devosia sp.]
LLHLKIGSAIRMGPGFFPLVLAGVLMLLGVLIAGKGVGRSFSPIGSIPWRGLVMILAAPIVFGFTVRGLGLVGSLALTIIVTSLANPRVRPASIAGVAVLLTAFCIGVFSYGLRLPLDLFGPWIGG